MQVAIRVDASREIGTGHFMRCLTLADALAEAGARIRFICRRLPDHLDALAAERGHERVTLPGGSESIGGDIAHARWLGASQADDARQTMAALADRAWAWMIVDHYAIDYRWETAVRSSAGRLLAIDDLADRRHECDVLLDQNLYPDMTSRYAGRTPAGCDLLLGPAFALLRAEFRVWRARPRLRDGRVQRILVLLGGADAGNYTARAVDALAAVTPRPQVDVVIGADHPAGRSLAAACAALGFALHVQAANIAELTWSADLAIGAAGSASWERCCLGVPAISLVTAANQEPIAAGLAAAGAVALVDRTPADAAAIGRVLRALLDDPGRVTSIGAAAGRLVDGSGALKVTSHLLQRAA